MNTICIMKYSLLLSSFALLLLFASCQNSYQQNVPAVSNQSPVIGVSNDVFQVTAQEYENYFESRYGLLYQKFNDRPFSGRILTIEQGAGGDYISSDESWAKGKKNGLSARWFSNGMKCMKGITAKVAGMALLPDGGRTVRKCMSELTQMVPGTVKKPHGVRTVHQSIPLFSLFYPEKETYQKFKNLRQVLKILILIFCPPLCCLPR